MERFSSRHIPPGSYKLLPKILKEITITDHKIKIYFFTAHFFFFTLVTKNDCIESKIHVQVEIIWKVGPDARVHPV